jgi:YaaC-like Protein
MPSGMQYLGSFQTGTRIETENPLEEVWSRVALLGSVELLRRTFTPSAEQDIEPYVQYAGVRARQAVEFREAARPATLLTSPLSLYYSFLNLMRSSLCLHSDVCSSRAHGLVFQRGENLLSSGAKIRPGTFADYLDEVGYPWGSRKVVTLDEVLSRIVEIRTDYATVYGQESLVVPIDVNAYYNGEVILEIPQEAYDLSNPSIDWTSELASLSGCCTVGPSGNKLAVTQTMSTLEDVDRFCNLRLDQDLQWREFASRWYLVRRTDPDLVFPRPAYYFIALFILGSIVRYEPELMLTTVNPESLSGWLFRRVVQAAERFFPQLMLSWVEHRPLYFKTAS